MRNCFLSVLLLLSHVNSFSQPDSSIIKSHTTNALILKVNPASLLDPQAPTLQFGAEYLLTKDWGIEVSVGLPYYGVYPRLNKDNLYHDDFKLKLQAKIYLPLIPLYYSGELFYTDVKYNSFGGSYTEDNMDYSFDEAAFKKKVYGLTLKTGFTASLSKRWLIESAAGGGIRRMTRTKVMASNAQPRRRPADDWGGQKIGTRYTPHIVVLELKFGYRLF